MEAPKKIWWAQSNPYWINESVVGNETQYIRADLVDDLIKAMERLVSSGLDQYTHHQIMSDPNHYVNVVFEKMRDVR